MQEGRGQRGGRGWEEGRRKREIPRVYWICMEDDEVEYGRGWRIPNWRGTDEMG